MTTSPAINTFSPAHPPGLCRKARYLSAGFSFPLREKNRVLVEYALGGNTKPIGVAVWDTGLTHALPEELQASLPTIEQIEAELRREEDGR